MSTIALIPNAALRATQLLIALVALVIAAPAHAADADPEAQALIEGIYDAYIGKPNGLDFTDEAEAKRIFTPELADLIARDVAESTKSGEVGRIDFDPFANAQDWEIKAVDLSFDQTAPDRATATATFDNLDAHETVRYELVKTAEGWRIGDIQYSDGDPSFREMLSEPTE